MEQLTEVEKEVLSQVLEDYREGVEDNCEDGILREKLEGIITSIERKLL